MSTNILSKVFIFATGAAIGSVVTWKVLEKKYSERLNCEIEEIERYYEENTPKDIAEYDDSNDNYEPSEEDLKEFADITSNYTGQKGGSESMTFETEPIERVYGGYVISPDDFDMEDDYDTETLTYYTDDVLADDNDDVIEDVENVVGTEFKSRFGEFEDDVVFVRNDRLKTDYEICRDYRPFSDVVDANLKVDK